MTHGPSDPVLLARDAAYDLGRLSEHLSQADPQQAAVIITALVERDEGVLSRLATLMATAAHYTRVAQGTFSADLCLALGSAANSLDDLCLDLDEHTDEIHLRASRAHNIPAAPATSPTPLPTKAASRPVRGMPS